MDRNSNEFKALQATWYKKLEKSGFKDIEQDEDNLKIWDSGYFRLQYNITAFQSKEEYYQVAGRFLHDYQFKTKVDKAVWELHCEGLNGNEITKALKSRHFKVHRNKVLQIIRDLNKIMLRR